jgi:2-octaprenyl-6-methoxyphenol hydroxylase
MLVRLADFALSRYYDSGSMETDFDILIVGGGLVGASLACALRESGLRVGMIEAARLPLSDRPRFDDRTLALAYGSRRIFEGLGVWRAIADRGAAPIRRIHISDRGRFGFARLHATDLGLEALGYVVSAPVLGKSLYEAIEGRPDIRVIAPAAVQSVEIRHDAAHVRVGEAGGARELTARLVVAADGANSPIREAAGIVANRIDYRQSAIVSAVSTERAHEGTAYERFTGSGPLALLPAGPDYCAVVWTVAANKVATVVEWDDPMFLAQLQKRFGERLGRFLRVGGRQVHPLALTRVREHVRPRLVIIGNAAHTVHPVAGQGFNLGLRDVAALAETLVEGEDRGDIGDLARLRRYAERRARDNQVVSGFTHSLVRIFSNDYWPIAGLRDAGLIAVDLLPPVKRGLIRITSGLAGRLPRLARGLPLRSSTP